MSKPNRVNDLYTVNTRAAWGKEQLSILTVHDLERAREDRKNGNS